MSDKADQREALVGEGGGKDQIIGIYTLLLERARDLGVDAQTLATYKQDFITELNKQLDKFMSSIRYDSTKLDNLMNALIQTIDNYQAKKAAPDSTVKLKGSSATASKTQMNAYNTAAKRLNKAQRDFNTQMKQDGWAGDVADAFGKIYGSENIADKVRADLRTCKKQMNQLKAALEQGDAAFRAKFKEIFGIPYNARNIQAYRDIEKTYLAAARVKAQEDTFKEEFSLLLNNKPLAEEGQMVTQSLSAGTSTYITTATKADVYKREFNKLAKLMGEDGANELNALVNGLAGTNDSLEKKYEALQKLAQNTFKNLQIATKKACGGRSFDSVQKQYDNSYKAAYGTENDILKRVTDYNISQQKGAGIVKGIGTALLTAAGTIVAVGSAGTLTPAVAATVAGVAAAAPAVVEVSDRATSGKALDSLKNDGVLAWLKTTNEETDWGSVAKTSLINGALSVVFMGQSYAVTGLCMKAGLGATTTGAANAAGIAATGLGTEYLMTGEISVEGAIFTVAMAVVGGVMTVKSIKAANAAESKARAEQHATDIQTSRHALGFEDGVKITPEGLKAQYKKLSLQNHPDRGGSAATMAEINNAYDFLSKNLADLNITAPKTTTASAKAPAKTPATKSTQTTETPKVTPDEIAAFSAELETMFPGDPENALWLKAYEQSPQATKWLCHNAEREINTKAVQLLASCVSNVEDVMALQRLVDMKSLRFVRHRNGVEDKFALDIEMIPELIEIEKQYPSVIQQMIKDPEIRMFDFNSRDPGGFYSLPFIVEAYQKNPQLVRDIISTSQETKFNNCMPMGMICKLSIDNPEGVMNFIKDPRNYDNIDWRKMFDSYFISKDNINELTSIELASIVNLYNKSPNNFHALTNSRDQYYSPYSVKVAVDAYETNPTLARYIKLQNKKNGEHLQMGFDECAKIKPSVAVDFLMEQHATPRQILKIAPLVGDNTQELSQLLKLGYDLDKIAIILADCGDSSILQLYTTGGLRYTGAYTKELIKNENRINDMLEIVRVIPNIDETQLLQILELNK